MSGSYSTPLDALPNGGSNEQDQFVEDFLKEMEVPPHQESNINTEHMGYATDQSQIPPEKMNQNFLKANHNENDIVTGSDNSKNPPSYDNMMNEDGSNSTEKKLKWVLNLIKLPAIVFVITFILSLPQFNRFVFNLLPSLLLESGQISIYGVLLKSIIALVIYIMVYYFL